MTSSTEGSTVFAESQPRTDKTAKARPERLTGIELGRIVACLAVIVIHQNLSDYGGNESIYNLFTNASLWAVPFFFMLSGYFMSVEESWVKLIVKYFVRLAPITIFWITIYAAIWSEPIWFLDGFKSTLKILYTGGAGYHLWFLPSLGMCLAIAAIFLHFRAVNFLFAIALAIFLVGLAFGPYAPAIYGVQHGDVDPPFNTRNGPFFGLIFLTLGVLLQVQKIRLEAFAGASLVAIGSILVAAEVAFLNTVYQSPTTGYDYLLGSVPLSLGMFILFLRLNISSIRMAQVVRFLGSASLGIYTVHAVVLQVVTQATQPASFGSGLAAALLVLMLSSAISLVGGQISVLRRVFR